MMIIKKENPNEFKQLYLHDFYISSISYDSKSKLYKISLSEDHFCDKSACYVLVYDVLHFEHTAFQPWNGEDGPLIINTCDLFPDVDYAIQQLHFLNRKYLCVHNQCIYKAMGNSVDISAYFLFSISLTSGDTIEFLTDKIEVEGVDQI